MNFLHTNDIGGRVVKDNQQYVLTDNTTLSHLVLSETRLHPNQQTNGHRHPGQEEVYYFISGQGKMVVGSDTGTVVPGSIVLIPDGSFHQVINTGDEDLVFLCVFEGARSH